MYKSKTKIHSTNVVNFITYESGDTGGVKAPSEGTVSLTVIVELSLVADSVWVFVSLVVGFTVPFTISDNLLLWE